MAVNLQTIKDIRNYLASELNETYSAREIVSLANIVLSSVLGYKKPKLLISYDESVSRRDAEKILKVCGELKTGKPIQYILGETIFYNCDIKVNPGVLIPRPETEELVDLLIKENAGFKGKILDIGTGSGCIAIAIAINLPGSRVTAIDNSEQALLTASGNAKLNRADILFLRADIFDIESSELENTDIVISNPPYIMDSEKLRMSTNVLNFEPHEALFVPDNDPLKFYRAILKVCNQLLNPEGRIYFEINESLGSLLASMIETYGYSNIKIIKDLNGKDRIIKGNKNV